MLIIKVLNKLLLAKKHHFIDEKYKEEVKEPI